MNCCSERFAFFRKIQFKFNLHFSLLILHFTIFFISFSAVCLSSANSYSRTYLFKIFFLFISWSHRQGIRHSSFTQIKALEHFQTTARWKFSFLFPQIDDDWRDLLSRDNSRTEWSEISCDWEHNWNLFPFPARSPADSVAEEIFSLSQTNCRVSLLFRLSLHRGFLLRPTESTILNRSSRILFFLLWEMRLGWFSQLIWFSCVAEWKSM